MEPGHNQTNSTTTETDSQQLAYTLPYENAVIDAFIVMANNAQSQAIVTKTACQRAMTENENTTIGMMPAYPHMHDAFASGIVYSTKSLLLSAEAAYQAQTSVCEALLSALQAAQKQREKLKQRSHEVSTEIAGLNQQATVLRAAFTKATDNPQKEDVYTTDEAKKLLECLETAYQKHNLSRSIQEHITEADANIEYLIRENRSALLYKNEIEKLLHRAEEEWQRITTLFNVDPSSISDNIMLTPLLGTQQELEPVAIPEPPQEEERPSAWSLLWSYSKIILLAFLIAIVLRAYVFDITRVEGTSMYPNLQNGDNVITSKITYLLGEPEQGDIVVLKAPDVPGADYIKRVVALPNDELEITDGKVLINGEILDEPYLDGIDTRGDIHTIIPEGFYFVMGDNRSESHDSRSESVGLISQDSIVGKAVFLVFPFDRFGFTN